MKYKRRIIEATLDRVRVGIIGSRRSGETKHVLAARLMYPRPAITEKLTVRTVTLKDGAVDLKKSAWSEKILFKEIVQGPFAVGVEISEALSDTEIDRFVELVSSSVLKLAGSELADMAAGPWAAGLVKLPLQYIMKVMASKKDKRGSLGAGSVDLCCNTAWKAGTKRKAKLPLVLDCDLWQTRSARRGGDRRTVRKKLATTGDDNGSVAMTFRAYD